MPVFRVSNITRTHRVLVVASGLEEFLEKARNKLNLKETNSMILTETDGLEVDEEEILLNLGKDERIIICEPNEKCMFEDMLATSTNIKVVPSLDISSNVASTKTHTGISENMSLADDSGVDGIIQIEEENEGKTQAGESMNNMESCNPSSSNKPVATPSSSGDACPGSQVTTVVLRPWKTPYQFPVRALPQYLQDHMRENRPLNSSQRRVFLSVLYEDVTKFTFYPVPQQYTDIIQGIFMKWPYLSNINDLQTSDACNYWRTKIREKFSNTRKRKDRFQSPVVKRMGKKQKMQEESAAETPGKAVKAWYGVPNYMPERPVGEDDKTIQVHIEWMQDEKRVRPRRPDYAKIKTLMTRTLADRRNMIIYKAASIADVLKEYPWLGDEDEMADEYKRLTTEDLPKQVDEFSKKYGKTIMNEVQKISGKRRPPLINLLVQKLQALRTEEERKDVMPAVAFCGMQVLLKEDSACFISRMQNQEEPVQLVYSDPAMDGPFDLIVEGVLVCRPKSLRKAVIVFLAAFYVFNLAYSDTLKKTQIFAQKIILKLSDNSEDNTRGRQFKDKYKAVLSIIVKLNNLIK